MTQKPVRKRGANYTAEEKSLLLDLVMQYKHVVENKQTGGIYIQKKKEAWNIITAKYNSNCTSGPRDTEQLKSLYDNMKQKSRKDLSESNKLAYCNAESSRMVTEEDVAQALRTVKEDKIQMHKTGGGFWKPKLTDNDAKVLAIIQDQIEPLTNPYDSASCFFKDVEIVDAQSSQETVETVTQIEIVNAQTQDTIENVTPEERQTPKKLQETKVTPARQTPKKLQETKVTPARTKVQRRNNVSARRKILKSSSAESLKRLYFKKKCQNADLERKKLMMQIINEKKEHNLRVQLLKKKISSNDEV